MQTSFSQSLFQSRIGRRILGLFVLCALVPTSILGWVSYRQVTEQLLVQTSARLKQESKSQGMVLYSHLVTLAADLDRIVAELPHDGIVTEDIMITASVKELGQRFRAIRLLAMGADRRGLTTAQIAHLREGKSLLEIHPSVEHRPQLTLTRVVNPDRWEAGLLSAHIDETALWSTQVKEMLPGNTDLVVEDGARQAIYSTFSQPVILPDFRRHDAGSPMGEGAMWQKGTQEYVAGAWSIPLRHTFLIEPLETISAIGQAILSSHEPAAMVRIIQSRITETIDCEAIGMFPVDPGTYHAVCALPQRACGRTEDLSLSIDG